MARFEEIAPLELRRLAELEKAAALHGPQTEPSILIEIQDLRHKYGRTLGQRSMDSRHRADLEYDFLMNTVAAALQRLTAIEAQLAGDDKKRIVRQRALDIWLGAISLGVIISIAIAVAQLGR